MTVPLTDTSIYLEYLQKRFVGGGGKLTTGARFEKPGDVSESFDIVINCAGIGARKLVGDPDLEPHRGQVVLVRKLDLPGAVVCDNAPLMYAIPRAYDCVFGGTNDESDDLMPDPATTAAIVSECCTTLKIAPPQIIGARVGLRPFRKSGVRLELDRMADRRPLIHNYGHGGSGFTLSWGCAQTALDYVNSIA
jgi:D-amino-acid oxidase